MHYMDMNEAYRRLDGIRGPGSCLSMPTSTPTRHQIGLFDCGSRVPGARVLYCAARLEGGNYSIIDPFSSNDSKIVFLVSK